MSMSFTNRENSVIDEPRREKTGIRGSLEGRAQSGLHSPRRGITDCEFIYR